MAVIKANANKTRSQDHGERKIWCQVFVFQAANPGMAVAYALIFFKDIFSSDVKLAAVALYLRLLHA